MRVRLTGLDDEELVVDGAAADPPQHGRPFAILVASLEKVAITQPVAVISFYTFITESGARYSWSRHVGEA